MKWFEPIIAIVAIFLVILPIILKIISHKKGNNSCSCGCACCTKKDECYKELKKYINSTDFQNDLKEIREN